MSFAESVPHAVTRYLCKICSTVDISTATERFVDLTATAEPRVV